MEGLVAPFNKRASKWLPRTPLPNDPRDASGIVYIDENIMEIPVNRDALVTAFDKCMVDEGGNALPNPLYTWTKAVIFNLPIHRSISFNKVPKVGYIACVIHNYS